MTTIIIADNLVNDYCGIEPRFTQRNVHIGIHESERIFGSEASYGKGPLPTFLHAAAQNQDIHLLFCRDSYSLENPAHREFLLQQGEHCLEDSPGADFPDCLKSITDSSSVINCAGLTIPLAELSRFLRERLSIDLNDGSSNAGDVQFLIVGFHTERRVFNTANLLRNVFGYPVAVFAHFLASSNKEFHYNALRYQFPDNRIQVINHLAGLRTYLQIDLDSLNAFDLLAVEIKPADIRKKLTTSQQRIVESICMHWTEAHLKPLGGGFSGSALFLANGLQGVSKTEPMVIKIDQHAPIRMEIKGYNQVKNFLGKHVPTFTFPVSDGEYSGIGMELAAMEGPPSTLQDHFEKAKDDYALDAFLKLLDRTLSMLTVRVYKNTFTRRRLAPYRHFGLHIAQQPQWLKANVENILGYETDNVFVSDDVLINIFNLVRKNSDAIFSDVCISHGDLNLANIIVDEQGNLWTIDWTHTGFHPLAMDFAKMENDVKFVISKELEFEDLPKLQLLEEHLLNKLVPEKLSKLPEHLQFIQWDLRFKKIYRTIRVLRKAYSRLMEDEDGLIYKIALLRYGLHTLSFDKEKGWGECKPAQLWYTLISVEGLLFQLVAHDYHLKIRGERPESYPERARIQIDLANWQTPCPEYKPPYYVSQHVLDGDRTRSETGYADPETAWRFEDFIDWGRQYSRDENQKPLNPSGRTGIAGRGDLWLWGHNPMIYLVPIRYDASSQQLEILTQSEQEDVQLISVHIRRDEDFTVALGRAKAKLNIPIADLNIQEIHQGYLYDPRQTDNAWIEARAYLILIKEEKGVKYKGVDERLIWKTVDPALINNLYSSYAFLLRKGIQYMLDNNLADQSLLMNILEKTG
ncbi:MAG: hypothetical protein EP344_19430 [Bacteroidetes bacterium]|nr:MAG: hypothetical protein EP344_19430 [Bacteroidota bacterium]